MSDVDQTRPPADRRVPALTDEVVAGWMAGQRWYAAKGLDPAIRVVARVDEPLDDVVVSTRFVLDEAPAQPVLYQVPLTLRTAPVDGLEHALIATDGETWLYDGPHDPAYAGWLVATIGAARTHAGSDARIDGTATRGADEAPLGRLATARVLSGEQSNTSVICTLDAPDTGASATSASATSASATSASATSASDTTAPADTDPSTRLIVKVFRVLHHGDNPDVTTQAALSGGGSARVPHSYGFTTGTWPDPGRPDGTATGHLAFAQEFLPGLEDAWRVALTAARDGASFVHQAAALGESLAEVHAVLARTMPTVPAGAEETAAAVTSMRDRLALAAAEVPDVAEHADAIGRLYDGLQDVHWPTLQRVHGDLHLGQVLAAPEPRGWVFLDFEGEPLRPMPERSRPDSPLRDVAGMLRSFDYVAGSLVREFPSVDTGSWAADARAAFLDGYQRASGTDLAEQQVLLDAFEVDKAVYEAVYEARNRPTWVAIPVDAVARLVARSAT